MTSRENWSKNQHKNLLFPTLNWVKWRNQAARHFKQVFIEWFVWFVNYNVLWAAQVVNLFRSWMDRLRQREIHTHSAPVSNEPEIDSIHSKIENICKVKPVNVVSGRRRRKNTFKWFCLLLMKLAVVSDIKRNPLKNVWLKLKHTLEFFQISYIMFYGRIPTILTLEWYFLYHVKTERSSIPFLFMNLHIFLRFSEF